MLAHADAAPAGARLWLAEKWPWTSGTEGAFSRARPRWAVIAIELEALARHAHRDPEETIRALNRELDPWPPESRLSHATSASVSRDARRQDAG